MNQTKEYGCVEFKNVVKNFGSVKAVKNVSFEINPGELVTLLGPSGCGKTTILRLIAGLENATEGSILIGGKDVTHLSATYRNVSMVFQSYALFPHMNVLQNVAYGLMVSNVPKNEARQKAEDALAIVGLPGYGLRRTSELSGGQQQRVAVARAIVLNPEVFLLDEPLSNLDSKLRRSVREEIRQLQLELNLTTICVTHDQEEAMAISDRIIVMKNAEIEQQGTPNDLYEHPKSSFLADFIGYTNILNCEVKSHQKNWTDVGVGSMVLRVRLGQLNITHGKLAVRPQSVLLHAFSPKNLLKGSIIYAAYLGKHIEYTIDSEVGELFAIDSSMLHIFPKGAAVLIEFEEQGIALVPE